MVPLILDILWVHEEVETYELRRLENVLATGQWPVGWLLSRSFEG